MSIKLQTRNIQVQNYTKYNFCEITITSNIFLKKQVFDLNCIVYSNATVHFPLRHISFDSKTRLKILYIMDFQKKKEGGPPTLLPSLLIVKLFYFFRTAVGVVVVYERRHFFHYFSPTYFYAKAKVILYFFFSILTRRLSVMAQTKEKQH